MCKCHRGGFCVDNKCLFLRKKPGNQWYLVSAKTGIIITGPHSWGPEQDALRSAFAWASSWGGLRIFLETENDVETKCQNPLLGGDGQA